MKKIVILLLTMLLIFAFVGCDTPSQPIIEDDLQEENFYSINEFISTYKSNKSGTNTLNAANDFTTENLFIPTLKSSEFKFLKVAVNEYNYRYYYIPANSSESKIFDYDTGIVIIVSRENNSFEIAMSKYNLTAVNGYAYEADMNTWHIDNNGKSVMIYFPDNIIFTEQEKICNYFEFEKVNTSSNDEFVK